MKLEIIKEEQFKNHKALEHAGLYTKPEFLKFLNRYGAKQPIFYHAVKDGQSYGYAIVCQTEIEWKYLLGEKKLFTIKTKGVCLRNLFKDLNPSVFKNISTVDVLNQQKVDTMLLFSVPTNYLNDTKKIKLNHPSGLLRYLPRSKSEHYHIEIKDDFDNYLSNFSRNSRQTLKKKVRRFSKRCKGLSHVKTYENENDLDEFFHFALSISRKTYQHRLLGSGLESSAWFRDYITFLARNGFLKAYILFDDRHPVAYLYSTHIDGHFETHKTGYDPAYSKSSPGKVLYYHVIKSLFDNKETSIIDFSTGEGPLKKLFATSQTECIDVYYIRKSFIPLSIVILHLIFSSFMNIVRGLIEKAGLKEKLKRFFRKK